MEQYLKGKKHLDAGNFVAARDCFDKSEAPERAYGLLALAAMTGAERTQALEQLTQNWEILVQQAAQGNAEDCFILGRCYETGSAVSPDFTKAMDQYTRAAGMGHSDAMYNLGCMFMHLGPDAAPMGAHWFAKAAELGHRDAIQALTYYQGWA